MRNVSTATTNAWNNPAKVGDIRPFVRATIQRLDVRFTTYNLRSTVGRWSGERGRGKFAVALLGQVDRPVELKNIKSVQWNRSVEQDIATCKITLWNTQQVHLGAALDDVDPEEFERPGFYTYNRGDSGNPWGYEKNDWRYRIMPDRIIRTYEGYGRDLDECPEKDENLYPSGVWRIDDVQYTTEGLIQLECRDIGSILQDQILFPPVVPFHEYPITFKTLTDGKNGRPPEVQNNEWDRELSDWHLPNYDTDSNQAWVGSGRDDFGVPIVGPNGSIRGHHGRDAFDADRHTYWLSVGHEKPTRRSSYEWVQGKFGARDVFGVKVKTWGGPYRIYVSVFADGEWKGRWNIPYRPDDGDPDNGSKIKFMTSRSVGKGEEISIKLPKKIRNATKVRITVHELYNVGVGSMRFRAGIREVRVATDMERVPDNGTHLEGNYKDYSDIVRWLLSWGGWYWPTANHRYNKFKYSDNTTITVDPDTDFDLFPPQRGGNIWGVIKNTGTYGVYDHGIEIWDKKPILDGIKYVKDIVGFNFYIDETGGAVWRRPNIYEKNNYVYPLTGGPETSTSNDSILIDEDTTLLEMTATISSKNVRERVFVANSNGKFGAVVRGYNPAKSHLRRVAGWTDENFETDRECKTMAKTIAMRQMLTYRENTLTIPGNPAIQIDDQIRIRERITGEQFRHYVKSITSDWDAETGKWTYQLQTHWLGDDPGGVWWYNADTLDDVERMYLGLL